MQFICFHLSVMHFSQVVQVVFFYSEHFLLLFMIFPHLTA